MNFIASWDVQTGGTVGVRESGARAKGRPSAVASSADGDVIGVAYTDRSTPGAFTICIYEIGSGECVDSRLFDGWFTGIWLHEQSLRFAAVEPGAIAVWEIPFASGYSRREVESLDIPANFNPSKPFVFLQTPYRLAYVVGGGVFIVDVQHDNVLLEAEDANPQGSVMTFSPDGRFFACGTTGPDIYLWKESPTGYILHQKFTSSTQSPIPLFSPDKASVVTWDPSTIQLWPLEGIPAPAEGDLPQLTKRSEQFLLDFSPGGDFAVAARRESSTVTILDLQPGAQRLTIDAGMEVYGLRAVGNTVVVEGSNKFVTWTLPVGNTVTLGVGDSVGAKTFKILRPQRPQATSISPNLLHIAVRGEGIKSVPVTPLYVRDVSTGGLLAKLFATGDMVWFSRNGSQVWCDGEVGKEQGWQVVKDSGSTRIDLDPLPVGSPPEGYPWRSSRGCTVTDDGWILDLEGKRLLWLPTHWRSYEKTTRIWSGPFLALLHDTLPEPIVLKLEV
jgi:WD40 repeat protein